MMLKKRHKELNERILFYIFLFIFASTIYWLFHPARYSSKQRYVYFYQIYHTIDVALFFKPERIGLKKLFPLKLI